MRLATYYSYPARFRSPEACLLCTGDRTHAKSACRMRRALASGPSSLSEALLSSLLAEQMAFPETRASSGKALRDGLTAERARGQTPSPAPAPAPATVLISGCGQNARTGAGKQTRLSTWRANRIWLESDYLLLRGKTTPPSLPVSLLGSSVHDVVSL